MPTLYLASTSPWRRKMLEDAGVSVVCESPGVEEHLDQHLPPHEVAEHLALLKAEAVAQRHPEAWVLGADQVLHEDGRHYGKPASAADHLQRLQNMRGVPHELVTGWALLGPGKKHVSHEVTRMFPRKDTTDAELEAYVATGEGSGCAGGYALEGRGSFLFERVDGDWFNIIGLPLFSVVSTLREWGWRFEGRS